jgi:hypothetical protein
VCAETDALPSILCIGLRGCGAHSGTQLRAVHADGRDRVLLLSPTEEGCQHVRDQTVVRVNCALRPPGASALFSVFLGVEYTFCTHARARSVVEASRSRSGGRVGVALALQAREGFFLTGLHGGDVNAQVTGIHACGWSDQLTQRSDWWQQCNEAGQLRTRIFFLRLVRRTLPHARQQREAG